jgi:SLOG cluster3 family
MPFIETTTKGRLRGTSILLSASVPSKARSQFYQRIDNALIAVSLAVFSEGGQLVFGGHPSISPLVVMIAREYMVPRIAEDLSQATHGEEGPPTPQVVIYQSAVWQEFIPFETQNLLAKLPFVHLQIVTAVNGEVVDPTARDKPQAPKSMELMRRKMIEETKPAAMVCIGGGLEGVEEEELFKELRKGQKIFVLETTGGAAAILAERDASDPRVVRIDRQTIEQANRFWQEIQLHRQEQGLEASFEPQRHYAPYTLIAQRIVEEIIERPEV